MTSDVIFRRRDTITRWQRLDYKGISCNPRLKVTIESQLRILNGIEFQMVAAECLKARDGTDLERVVASRS